MLKKKKKLWENFYSIFDSPNLIILILFLMKKLKLIDKDSHIEENVAHRTRIGRTERKVYREHHVTRNFL